VLLAQEMERRQASRLLRAKEDATRQQRVQAELASKEQAIKVRRAVYEQRRTSAQLKQFYNKYVACPPLRPSQLTRLSLVGRCNRLLTFFHPSSAE
jgi:hypothetical protein